MRERSKFQKISGPFFLGGPTGVGKSEIAVELASHINGEIVGADAFQIYAELPVLTAQPAKNLQTRIPHHLVGYVGVKESYNVERYRQEASQRMEEIIQRGKTPIVVGGTGLYFHALIRGLDPAPVSNSLLRQELEQLPLHALQKRLVQLDPDAAAKIDLRNPRRILRAIEICELSGKPLKDFRSHQGPISATHGWFLVRDREDVHNRILANVQRMWEQGVVQEVEKIQHRVGPTASRAIGFKEIFALLRGDLTEIQCQEAICQATRRYAKRQLTWFRHQTTFKSLNLSQFNQNTIIRSLLSILVSPR